MLENVKSHLNFTMSPFAGKIATGKQNVPLWNFQLQPSAGNPTEASEVLQWGHAEGFVLHAPSRRCRVVLGRAAAL